MSSSNNPELEDLKNAEQKRIFARNLKNERKRQGYSVEQLAASVGKSPSHCRTLEASNRNLPSFSLFLSICNALHCNPNRLLEGLTGWNETDESRGLEERFSKLTPHQLSKANRMLDLMFDL